MAEVQNRDQDQEEWRALDLLLQFGNPFGILELFAEGAPVRDWVRVGTKMWLDGKCPSLPKDLTDENKKLAAAINAYRTQTDEERGDQCSGRIRRIADEHGVLPALLEPIIIKGQGGRCRRIRQYEDDWREWERVYLSSEFYDQLSRPLKTQS
jgi:hypothetical protein